MENAINFFPFRFIFSFDIRNNALRSNGPHTSYRPNERDGGIKNRLYTPYFPFNVEILFGITAQISLSEIINPCFVLNETNVTIFIRK